MVTCNHTLEDLSVDGEIPYTHNLTFHKIGLIISAAFGLVAVVVAFWLMFQHALHYSKPSEQRHIIRILFMIPVYAMVSFLSYYYYKHAIYFEVIRDCYEAFAISSFFALLCHYCAPDLHTQKDFFRQETPRNWVWPLTWMQKCSGGQDKGWLRKPKSGLTWFNVIWLGVFQYCFIRVLFTIVSVATQAIGRYCSSSLNPAFAHIWVMTFEAVSVTFAMYALIQFYIQLKERLSGQRPGMKLLCIKLVIFLSFWQTIIISFLVSSNGPMKATEHIAYPDMAVGIPSMLLCVEMAIFAFLHFWAFPWRPYAVGKDNHMTDFPVKDVYQGGPFGIRAWMDAFNPWDIVKASARGFRWLFVGRKTRHQDSSYHAPGSGTDISNATKLGPVAGAGSLHYDGQDHSYPVNGLASNYNASQQWDGDLSYHSQTAYGPTAYDSSNLHPGAITAAPAAYHPPSSRMSFESRDEEHFENFHAHNPPPYSRSEYSHSAEDRAGLLQNASHPAYTNEYNEYGQGQPHQ